MLIVLARDEVSLCVKTYVDAFLLKFALAVITLVLQHEHDKRRTVLELSQSPFLPSRLEDEYIVRSFRLNSHLHVFKLKPNLTLLIIRRS
jgi:hypothetical protein